MYIYCITEHFIFRLHIEIFVLHMYIAINSQVSTKFIIIIQCEMIASTLSEASIVKLVDPPASGNLFLIILT